jgi:hypothetical protein
MKRQLGGWLGAGMLGTMLMAGCSNASSRDTTNPPLASGQGRVMSQPQTVVAGSPCPVCQPTVGTITRVTAAPPCPAYQPSSMPATTQTVARVEAQPSPPVRTGTPVQQAAAWQQAADPQATAQQTAAVSSNTAPAPARSFTDSASHFAHAADYTWLAGQIEKTRLGHGWRLRYATVDEDDPHGGSVSLSDEVHLPGLQDGQYIRARGYLVDPEARGTAPAYHVESVEVLE